MQIFVRAGIRTACESPIRNRHFEPIILTPSAKELAITFRPGIGISYGGTIRNRHSKTVDRTLVLRNSVSGPKFHHGACVLVHRLSYPLGKTQIFVRAAIGSARESPIRNRHFEPIRRFPVRRPNYSPGTWLRAADAIAYGHPIAQTGITFRSVIGIAYKTTIQNRHSETLVALLFPQVIRRHFGVEKPSFHTPKLRFRLAISPFPRFSRCNVSLDHVYPGRGNHTESTCHGDRKLCSTRCENSSPAWSRVADGNAYGHRIAQTGITFRSIIRIAYKTPIRNRHSETLVALLLPQAIRRHFGIEKPSFHTLKLRFQPTISPFPRFSHCNVSLDYVNPGRGNHTESTCHGDQKLCSTQRENSSPELAITFCSGNRIAYVSTIQNRHSETVDRRLVFRNSVPVPKFHHGACVLVHRLSYPLGKMRIFIRAAIGTARESPIQNRHFEPVGTRSNSEISGPAPKLLSGSVVAGCRCDRIRTQHRSNGHNVSLEIAYVSTIRNRHSETVDKTLVLRNSMPGPKFHHGACILVHRLSYPLGKTRRFICAAIGTARESPIRNRHFEPVGTRSNSEISGPAPKLLSGSVVAGCRCDRIRTPHRSNGHNFPLSYWNRL
ncbi:hypothetical protein Taro_033888 [Colocasia esculenta]|uniref:Uncharacterized protein n=1 Tax=Colocasia esculenta TaxID=4460 RepID=A0A843W5Z7_COLES|nr:hypothetical protein [Colocasia esculenta]